MEKLIFCGVWIVWYLTWDIFSSYSPHIRDYKDFISYGYWCWSFANIHPQQHCFCENNWYWCFWMSFLPWWWENCFFFTWQAWNFLVYFSQDENISIFFKRCSILKKICIHEISATLLPLFQRARSLVVATFAWKPKIPGLSWAASSVQSGALYGKVISRLMSKCL